MRAPHPSVVPFEFATTGALVITNVYENRSAAQLRGICANIIPCEVSLADVTRALVDAVERVNDFERRERNAYRPATQTWEQIFSDAFIARTFAVSDPVRAEPAAGGGNGEDTSSPGPRGWLTRILSGARSTR